MHPQALPLALVVLSLGLHACQQAAENDPPAADSGSQPTNDAQILVPGACDFQVTLDLLSSAPTQVGPTSISAEGVNICLCLEGIANQRAHFMAHTPHEDGTLSSIQLALFDMQGTLLRQGWDVTIGQSEAASFANLEWSLSEADLPPETPSLNLILHAATKMDARVTSTVELAFFDPLE